METQHICGIDEAGRGPLAGPVFAAAVVLPASFPFEILDDSKKLSEKKREAAALIIREKASLFGIGEASHEEIDALNILKASLLAMRRAVQSMLQNSKSNAVQIRAVIVDGLWTPDVQTLLPEAAVGALVKADAKVHAVMAASILAKTARDAQMRKFAALYPQYLYDKHKGYPTKEHRALIKKYGNSPIQRLSFRV